MFRHRLLTVVLLLIPSSVQAQTGAMTVTNNTGQTVRIGVNYYIDAAGNRVNLTKNDFWDIAPGTGERRLLLGGQNVIVRKFGFYSITPEGESAWESLGPATALNGNGEFLTKHRQAIGRDPASGFPALTAKRANLVNANASIERLRTEVNTFQFVVVPAARVARDAAQAEYNRRVNNGAPFGQILVQGGVLAAAEAALAAAQDSHRTATSNLQQWQTYKQNLESQPGD